MLNRAQQELTIVILNECGISGVELDRVRVNRVIHMFRILGENCISVLLRFLLTSLCSSGGIVGT